MRKWLKNWLFKEELERDAVTARNILGTRNAIYIENESTAEQPHVRMGVLNVMNGKLLEVSTYKRNPNGPDWLTNYWVLNEEMSLPEQIAMVMKLKGMEK